LEAIKPYLRDLYGSMDVQPRELLEYLTGPTRTSDETTLEEILGSRYLMLHEAVEILELKRRGIPIDDRTIVNHPIETYEAHMRAAEVEFTLAEREGDRRWLERRLRDAESWLRDPQLPPHLRSPCEGLLRRFRQKKAGAYSDRLEEAE